jgi:ABC-type lipoprotein export system ATPase subunit
MGNNYVKGAEWRKWDLHIHTPKSICQSFGTDNDDTWDLYITDLENLSIDFAVVGINDYLFLDGYEKLRKAQNENKRIPHLKLFPVVEFRIEKFAGVQFGNLKRINLHVIFSDEIPLETIKSQFLNTLEQSYTLTNGESWTRAITYESVSELGAEIKLNVPPDQLHNYGSDLTEGFNNLNVKEEQIFKSLDKDCFKNKYLIAIGKTEWGELKWTDASIATKKSIINSADIVFTAAESIDAFNNAKHQLTIQGVNDLLLDCSDAHYISTQTEKDRIGNCNTWIKADPTFDGLRQVINEPVGRVFIGDKPPVFNRIITNRTKYLKELNISQVVGYDGRYGTWFDNVKIPLNSELVAIIGNKGSGKSAIADMIALCGDYNNHDDFSFLRKKKFRDGKHAKNFVATLLWESGKVVPRNLDDIAKDGAIEEVKYLPQGQFERLTNEVSSTEEFQNEIEKVVFTHIDESERYNTSTFSDLVEYQKQSVDAELESLVKDLNQINTEIILLESKENPAYKTELLKKKEKKEEELQSLIEPPIVSDPNEDPEKKKVNEEQLIEIARLKESITSLEAQQEELEGDKKQLLLDLQLLKQTRKELEFKALEVQQYVISKNEALLSVGVDISKAFVLKTDYSQFEANVQIREQSLNEIKMMLGEGVLTESDLAKSIPVLLNAAQKMLESEQTKLGTEQKAYQQYLLDKMTWEKKKKEIIGDIFTPDSITFYEAGIVDIETKIKAELDNKYLLRKEKLKEIFKRKLEVINIYKAVKNRIDSVIDDNKELLKTYPINIEASLVLKPEFIQKFMSFINKQKAGTFRNINDGENQLKQIISGVDFDKEDAVIDFLDSIIRALKEDQREGQDNKQYRFVGDQVAEIKELYAYLFSLRFLDYNYQLKQGDKKLEQLSPGERGALLLIFYLILDKNDIPLIIDQPEDNLDNYSVANILVPFIREAKKKRQIIMVTHNPNLAVVADAEQVIFANLEKENDNKFSFISGSIENREVNKCIVKVLEGAMPAFNKRKQKYYE